MNGAVPHEPVRALVIACVLVTAFAFFLVYPNHDPKPNGLPVAVTGTAGAQQLARTGLDFDIRRYDSEDAARDAVLERDAYGAVLDDRTLVAGAASLPAAQLLGEIAERGRQRVEDVRPLDSDDPRNTSINFATLAILVPSILGAMLLFVMAPRLEPRSRVGLLAGFAVVAGLLATFVLHVLIGVLPGPFVALWGVAALGILAMASISAFLMQALGPPGVGLSFILFLMLANPGSGAASAPELLPDPWSWAGQLLPPGALATGLRNTAYFDAANALVWVTVLVVFVAAAVAGLLLRRPSAS